MLFLCALPLTAAPPCDLSRYHATDGLAARIEGDALELEWTGERSARLRAVFAVEDGRPVVRRLAARSGDGPWRTLGEGLSPEFGTVAGRRRISEQQLNPLRRLGVELTPELLEEEKWKVFWDAPLNTPGLEGVNPGLPRTPDEIRRDTAEYDVRACTVRSDGARIEVSFDGVRLGPFAGRLQYTVYRGSNLLRQEVIVKTEEPSLAYKYSGGLKGFSLDQAPRLVWRDTARGEQHYLFGGSPNRDRVALRARNRLAAIEFAEGGSLVFFPPPHKFFFAREIELNLGYVWYRKDDADSFSVGVRHADREEMYRPYGVSEELWEKRVRQSRRFALGNFALYNAPPGSEQRMAVYFYLSPDSAAAARENALAYTHQDRYKPVPGYQVAVCHFHTHFGEQLADAGSLDLRPPWIPAFRAMGINIAMMSDFHGDGHANDPGPLRFEDQHTYFEGSRRHSDRDFLIMPGEEPSAYIGGHYTMIFPRPVYWSKVREPGQSFMENHSKFGKAYHVGSSAEVLDMLGREGGLIWQAHPRTKGSTLYPDAIRDSEGFRSDRYLGAAFQSFPVDLSEKRLCEKRCLDLLDDMNNWAGPKYLFAEGDTYTKYPDDEIYGELAVNYVKVDPLPAFDEDWSPILKAIRAGDFFVTTGEVLILDHSVTERGGEKIVSAEVEWTFPLEFVEAVWGDGERTERKIVSASDTGPFGKRRFEIAVPAENVKWVRFAVWDSAGNGAFTQPVHFR